MRHFVLGLGLMALLGAGCAQQIRHTHHPEGLTPEASDYLARKSRGNLPSFDLPIEVNDRVVNEMRRFLDSGTRDRFGRYLSRSGRYELRMKELLREEKVPEDLFYLAMIESGFSTFALSRARALGPWQFIRSTGRHYGLRQNWWIDERKDFEKSTRSAARYLKNLYQEFGDWYLAMAAYNAGEGRIRRAIREAGSDDFWTISAPGTRYLKRETQDYVPRVMAAAILAKMPNTFGFRHIQAEEPLLSDTVQVKGPMDLNVAARLVNASIGDLVLLNPELNQTATPPGEYTLRIPVGSRQQFDLAYAALPPEQRRVTVASHRVRRGETLSLIARKYHISVDHLMVANNLNSRQARHLRVGKSLTIPGRVGTTSSSVAFTSSRSVASDMANSGTVAANVVPTESVATTYRVRKGDTLARIAVRHGTSVTALKRHNNLRGNFLRVGQRLQIGEPVPAEAAGLQLASTRDIAYGKEKKDRERVDGVEYLIREEQKSSGVVLEDFAAQMASADQGSGTLIAEAEVIDKEGLAAAESPDIREETLPSGKFVLEEESPVITAETVAIPPKFSAPQSGSRRNGRSLQVASAKPEIHSVRHGENLWSIARKYPGISPNNLKEWNGLSGSQIRPGQKLSLIPAAPSLATPTPVSGSTEEF